jgi:hypothetical protein
VRCRHHPVGAAAHSDLNQARGLGPKRDCERAIGKRQARFDSLIQAVCEDASRTYGRSDECRSLCSTELKFDRRLSLQGRLHQRGLSPPTAATSLNQKFDLRLRTAAIGRTLSISCSRRLNIDPPCRFNIDPREPKKFFQQQWITTSWMGQIISASWVKLASVATTGIINDGSTVKYAKNNRFRYME